MSGFSDRGNQIECPHVSAAFASAAARQGFVNDSYYIHQDGARHSAYIFPIYGEASKDVMLDANTRSRLWKAGRNRAITIR